MPTETCGTHKTGRTSRRYCALQLCVRTVHYARTKYGTAQYNTTRCNTSGQVVRCPLVYHYNTVRVVVFCTTVPAAQLPHVLQIPRVYSASCNDVFVPATAIRLCTDSSICDTAWHGGSSRIPPSCPAATRTRQQISPLGRGASL